MKRPAGRVEGEPARRRAREADALWQRFRTACDRFFDRSSRRDELAQEEALAAGAARSATRLDALAAALAADDAPSTERRAAGRSTRRGPSGCGSTSPRSRTARPLAERLHAACSGSRRRGPRACAGTRLDPATTRDAAREALRQLEELVPAAAPPPNSCRSRRWRWRCGSAWPPTRSRGATAATGPKQDVGARGRAHRAQLGAPRPAARRRRARAGRPLRAGAGARTRRTALTSTHAGGPRLPGRPARW